MQEAAWRPATRLHTEIYEYFVFLYFNGLLALSKQWPPKPGHPIRLACFHQQIRSPGPDTDFPVLAKHGESLQAEGGWACDLDFTTLLLMLKRVDDLRTPPRRGWTSRQTR
jgi:hypothetical protein